MNKHWDYDVPKVDTWKEIFRVLKPGAHILVACGTRTQHRMAVNIEDAGFEIRDVITWHYGSGFPKSLNIGKSIDALQGNEREVVNTISSQDITSGGLVGKEYSRVEVDVTKGNSEWGGWGTALKPATEFWTLARKPLSEKTVATNVLKWGTGGLNIDSTRITSQNDNEVFYKRLSSLDYSSHTSFSSLKQVLDYFEHISSALEAYNNFYKVPSHDVVFSVSKKHIEFQGVAYDSYLLFQNGALCVQTGLTEVNFQYGYPTLFRLYDECFDLEKVPYQDAFALLSDVRKYISHYRDLLKNNHDNYNNLLLFSFLALPYLIFSELINSILHKDNKCLSNPKGRFPANVIFDEFTGKIIDAQSGTLRSGSGAIRNKTTTTEQKFAGINPQGLEISYADGGGASRFFYCAKASKNERNDGLDEFDKKHTRRDDGQPYGMNTNKLRPDGSERKEVAPKQNHHPTVKPVKLMQYLVRLITPPNGLILDPFAGSCTTGIAAKLESFSATLIERELEYCEIGKARINAQKPQQLTTLFD